MPSKIIDNVHYGEKSNSAFSCKLLIENIVLQAARDWYANINREIDKRLPNRTKMGTFYDISSFFKSEYGEWMCASIGYDARRMLSALEETKKLSISSGKKVHMTLCGAEEEEDCA